MLKIEGRCVFTGEYYSVLVKPEQYRAWQNGTVAQEAFPDLSADDREFIISGISPKGWALMSANMDEEFEGDI